MNDNFEPQKRAISLAVKDAQRELAKAKASPKELQDRDEWIIGLEEQIAGLEAARETVRKFETLKSILE